MRSAFSFDRATASHIHQRHSVYYNAREEAESAQKLREPNSLGLVMRIREKRSSHLKAMEERRFEENEASRHYAKSKIKRYKESI